MVDVAAAAGVSQPTASRVFSGDTRVNPATRDAVLAAAERMGYVINRAASSLASNRTNSIGFVIAEPSSHLWGNPYFPRLLAGVAAAAEARRQQLLLFMPQSPADRKRLATYLTTGHVDGVLMVTSSRRDSLLRHLLDNGMPVVVGGRPIGAPQACYVDIDNRSAGYTATAHLLERGYRTVATIAGPASTAAGADRLAGYTQAIRDLAPAGTARIAHVAADYSHRAGQTAASALLDGHPEIDAIFAAADLLCFGALETIQARGLDVPGRIGLVSFDDSPPDQETTPPLTSIHQPVEQLGEQMVELLMSLVDESRTPNSQRIVLPTRLIERASSGGPTPR